MSSFKAIILAIFIVAAVVGVLMFSGIINIGGSSSTSTTMKGSVAVWGTVPYSGMSAFLQEYNLRNQDINVSYQEKDEATFASELIEAIASGQAPDLILLPDNLLGRFSDKLDRGDEAVDVEQQGLVVALAKRIDVRHLEQHVVAARLGEPGPDQPADQRNGDHEQRVIGDDERRGYRRADQKPGDDDDKCKSYPNKVG